MVVVVVARVLQECLMKSLRLHQLRSFILSDKFDRRQILISAVTQYWWIRTLRIVLNVRLINIYYHMLLG